jgi:translocation and assembly module TamB
VRLQATAHGPKLGATVEAHGAGNQREVEIAVDKLSLTYQAPRYAQSIALEQPARLLWRDGDRVELGATHVRGTGYLLTGQLAAEGFYRLRPPRKGAEGPLGHLQISLRRTAVAGLDPIDAEVDATVDRARASATIDASLAGTRVHADASLPVTFPRGGGGGPPRPAAHGPIAAHVSAETLALTRLPQLGKQLARHGIAGAVIDVHAALDGDIAQPTAQATVDVRDVIVRRLVGTGRRSNIRALAGVGLSLHLETQPGQLHAEARARVQNKDALAVDVRAPFDAGDLLRGADLLAVPLEAKVDIPAQDIAPYMAFATGTTVTKGQLAGHAAVRGTARHPEGTVELALSNVTFDRIPIGAIELHATADRDHATATLAVADPAAGRLTAEGTLDLAGGGAYQATVRTDGLELGFARLLAPDLHEIAGKLRASLDLKGTLAGGIGGGPGGPALHGAASISDGRLGLRGQPTFTAIETAAEVRPGRVDLTRIAARSGDGNLHAKGWVILDGLRPKSLVLTAQAHDFQIAAAGNSAARLEGDVSIEAALRDSVLAGTVAVPKATLWLPRLGTGGSRNLQSLDDHPDVRFVDQAGLAARAAAGKGGPGAAPPRAIDIHAHAGTFYVRGRDLDVELESDLRVTTGTEGPERGQPLLSGSVRVRRGRIDINSQRFDIEQGTATFDGSADINPELEIRLTRQYPEAQVTVRITGTPRRPTLEMTSDPPVYDKSQIVSLILTGQAGGQTGATRADPTSAITTAVLGRIADTIAPELGLDVLRVQNIQQTTASGQPLGGTDTRVEVGKFVSERIYVSYAHIFGTTENQNSNEAHVEYRITARWMLETIFGDAGVGGVNVVWTSRY